MYCSCENATYKTAYLDLVRTLSNNPNLKPEEIPLTPLQIRKDAAQQFRPVHAEGQKARALETSGTDKYDVRGFRVTNRGVEISDGAFTGKTLRDFDERTRTLAPHLYKESDATTNRLIESAFKSGATRVVTSYENDKGSRDLIIMELKPQTNEGTIRVINTSVDGINHTFDGIKRVAEQEFSDLRTIAPEQKVFILTDAAIPGITSQPNILPSQSTGMFNPQPPSQPVIEQMPRPPIEIPSTINAPQVPEAKNQQSKKLVRENVTPEKVEHLDIPKKGHT